MPTFNWTFAADDKGAAQMMKNVGAAVREMEAATGQAAGKMTVDLNNITAATERTAKGGKTLAEAFSSGLGQNLQSMLPAGLGNVTQQLGGVTGALGSMSVASAAATAGVAVAGAAAVKFGVDAVKSFESSALAVRHYQEIAGGTAQEASVMVGAAKELGVSSDTLAVSFSRLEKNLGANTEKFAAYGIEVKKNADGSTNMVETVKNVVAALGAINDPVQRAVEGNALFGRSWATMADLIAQGSDVLNSAIDSASAHAPVFNQQDLADAVKLREETVALGQEWDKLKAKMGEKLVPFLEQEIAGIERLGRDIADIHDKWDSFGTDVTQKKPDDSGWSKFFKDINQGLADTFAGPSGTKSLSNFADQADETARRLRSVDFSAKLHELYPFNAALTDAVPPMTGLGDAAGATVGPLNSVAGAMSDAELAAQGLAGGTAAAMTAFQQATTDIRSAADVRNAQAAGLEQLDALNTKVGASSTAVADAQVSGAKSIASAQKSVDDAVKSAGDAQASYAKAVDDANRNIARSEDDYAKTVADANQKVADVEKSTSKSIVDAQQKVTDARHRAAEAAVNSARRVQDATQALLDAETTALSDPNTYTAQRKREEAGQNLTRAQEDAAQQQADSADTVGRAEQDLADTQVKAAEDRARAEQDAADQIAQAQQKIADAHRQAADSINSAAKQVADAQGRVSDAQAKVESASIDAQAAVEKAGASAASSAPSHDALAKSLQGVVDNAAATAYQMKLAGASDQDIQAFLATTTTTVDTYAGKWGFTAAEIQEYNRQVSLIVHTITVTLDLKYNMSLNTRDFYDKINAAAAQLHVSGEQLLADSGSLGITPQLQAGSRDSGGWLPTGVSLLANNTGRPERILSPAEMDGNGGGGLTVNVLGSVISDRDLADIVARAIKRGNLGFGN